MHIEVITFWCQHQVKVKCGPAMQEQVLYAKRIKQNRGICPPSIEPGYPWLTQYNGKGWEKPIPGMEKFLGDSQCGYADISETFQFQ